MKAIELINLLEKGLILEKIKNQFGENIVAHELRLSVDDEFEERRLVCLGSSALGLGTCKCVSHEPYMQEIISPAEALKLIKTYLENEENAQ